MSKAISEQTRESIIYHKQNGAKNAEIVKWLRVSKASVKRIWKQYREEKSIGLKYHNSGRRAAFCDAKLNKIREKIREQPDITLEEILEQFHVNISVSALSRKLIKQDLSFKKRRYTQKNGCVPMSKGIFDSL